MKNVKNEMERQLYKKPRTTAEPAMRAKMISRIVIKAEPVINCIGGRRKNMTRPETKEKVPARSRIRAFLASSSMISWNCVVKFSYMVFVSRAFHISSRHLYRICYHPKMMK